jgi:hypothetical protein
MCPQLVFAARPHLCLHFPRFELPLTLTQEIRGVNAWRTMILFHFLASADVEVTYKRAYNLLSFSKVLCPSQV